MDIVWNLPLLQQPGGSMTTSLVTFGLVIAIQPLVFISAPLPFTR